MISAHLVCNFLPNLRKNHGRKKIFFPGRSPENRENRNSGFFEPNANSGGRVTHLGAQNVLGGCRRGILGAKIQPDSGRPSEGPADPQNGDFFSAIKRDFLKKKKFFFKKKIKNKFFFSAPKRISAPLVGACFRNFSKNRHTKSLEIQQIFLLRRPELFPYNGAEIHLKTGF